MFKKPNDMQLNLLLSIFSILLLSTVSFGDAFAADAEITLKAQGQPFKDLDKRVTAIEESSTTVPDSFFDVFFRDTDGTFDSFFDIFVDLGEDRTIDSFFDIFTEFKGTDEELQAEIDTIDTEIVALQASDHLTVSNIGSSGEDGVQIELPKGSLQSQIDTIETEIVALELRGTDPDTGNAPDSFFDVFTEISVHDADIDRIDTEILSMDLRGDSCIPGSVVVGVDDSGNLLCASNDDNDPANELQTLSLAGNQLSISSGNSVTLPAGGTGGLAGYEVVLSGLACKGLTGFHFGPNPAECDIFDNSGGLEQSVTCPAGKQVLGGGFDLDFVTISPHSVIANHPVGTDGWTVEIIDTNNTYELRVYAICA